jgi:hypothetical protein
MGSWTAGNGADFFARARLVTGRSRGGLGRQARAGRQEKARPNQGRGSRANAAPRCGARSKRTGKPCQAAAMSNGRCKFHGGKSTGPRTPEGLERSRRANRKHGYYSREAKAERQRVKAAAMLLRYLRIIEGFGD